MAKIDIVSEMLEKHTDAEVVEYLDRTLSNFVSTARTCLTTGNVDMLLSDLGDVNMVSAVLRGMRKRNQERVAKTNSLV